MNCPVRPEKQLRSTAEGFRQVATGSFSGQVLGTPVAALFLIYKGGLILYGVLRATVLIGTHEDGCGALCYISH